MGSRGFDDDFDEQIFRAQRLNTRLERPAMWPRSTSEMGMHTSFGGQGLAGELETGYSDYQVRRAPAAPGAPCWTDRPAGLRGFERGEGWGA